MVFGYLPPLLPVGPGPGFVSISPLNMSIDII